MRFKPFLIGPNEVEPEWPPVLVSTRLLGAVGIHWGAASAPEPSGTIVLWLFCSHHRYARTRHPGNAEELIEHYRFRSYDLDIEAGSRTVCIPLVGPSNRPRR